MQIKKFYIEELTKKKVDGEMPGFGMESFLRLTAGLTEEFENPEDVFQINVIIGEPSNLPKELWEHLSKRITELLNHEIQPKEPDAQS